MGFRQIPQPNSSDMGPGTSMSSDTKPIIIIKKKSGGHGGHHGGAWKVAYADFVTAMMALFIVLWLMNSNTKVKEAVSGYFKDPSGFAKLAGVGKVTGSSSDGGGNMLVVTPDNMAKLKENLEKAIKSLPDFDKMKDQVEITITAEGLRIELLETQMGMFFESGRPQPTPNGTELLKSLAGQLGGLPNRLVIEGHTDSKPFNAAGTYSNWELSSDRANQARQIMQSSGLRSNQVLQVRGFADQALRNVKDPEDAGNRRISVIVHYQEAEEGTAPSKARH
jgi:chemotaxis protein MotB